MKIKICMGKTCKDRFSEYIFTRLKNDKIRFNLNNLELEECMCLGQCAKGPNIVVYNKVINYSSPAKASEQLFRNENNI